MSVQALLLVGMGVAFVAYGYRRARYFWSQYQALASTQANVERYERWRGGVRAEPSDGPDERMKTLRRRAAIYGLVVLFGFSFIVEGFALK